MTRAVDRAFDILEVLAAADAVSLARIREEVEIAPAPAHPLLQTMVRRGYAAQDRRMRHYGPGPKVLEVADRSATNGNLDLRPIAVPSLRKLTAETGETSIQVLPYGTDDVVYIEQVKSTQMVRSLLRSATGRRSIAPLRGRSSWRVCRPRSWTPVSRVPS